MSGSERQPSPTGQTGSGHKSKRSPLSAKNKPHACVVPFLVSWVEAQGSGHPMCPACGLGVGAKKKRRTPELFCHGGVGILYINLQSDGAADCRSKDMYMPLCVAMGRVRHPITTSQAF